MRTNYELGISFQIFKFSIFQFFLSLLLFPLLLNAQDSVLEPGEKKDTFNYNRVMVIPFDPQMYFSDCDKEIAETSKKKIKEIHLMFRQGLDYTVNMRVLDRYETHQILKDTSLEAHKDLLSIYQGISYKHETPSSVLIAREEKKKKTFINQFQEKLNGGKKKDNEEQTETGQKTSRYKENADDSKYMDAVVHSPEMLQYMGDKYGTDLFVFINQFELKTNFENCLDRAANIYEREIKVHFSIYDKSGKHLYGDVIAVTFPSNTDNIDNIMRKNFPLISDYLAGKLPNPGRMH
jgi:hypothetical protein